VKILLASGNRKKAGEIRAILREGGGVVADVLSLADFPEIPPAVEDGDSFLANARKKARPAAQATGLPTLGEDSGIEIDALDGAPGIYSARYAGETASDDDNWRKLLREIDGVPPEKRTARYRCVAVLAWPEGREIVAEGSCEGRIALEPQGSGGFGYDPVFLLGDGRTMAQVTAAEKDAISHRGKALRRLKRMLEEED